MSKYQIQSLLERREDLSPRILIGGNSTGLLPTTLLHSWPILLHVSSSLNHWRFLHDFWWPSDAGWWVIPFNPNLWPLIAPQILDTGWTTSALGGHGTWWALASSWSGPLHSADLQWSLQQGHSTGTAREGEAGPELHWTALVTAIPFKDLNTQKRFHRGTQHWLIRWAGTVRKHERKGRRHLLPMEFICFWWNKHPKSHQVAPMQGSRDLTSM